MQVRMFDVIDSVNHVEHFVAQLGNFENRARIMS